VLTDALEKVQSILRVGLSAHAARSGLQDSVRGFTPDLFTHPGRTVTTWKTPFDGENRTQAGSLCYIGFPYYRAISQSYRRAPGVTTRRRKVA
jgi:hypothetical protein